jgi:hypothetical protein
MVQILARMAFALHKSYFSCGVVNEQAYQFPAGVTCTPDNAYCDFLHVKKLFSLHPVIAGRRLRGQDEFQCFTGCIPYPVLLARIDEYSLSGTNGKLLPADIKDRFASQDIEKLLRGQVIVPFFSRLGWHPFSFY